MPNASRKRALITLLGMQASFRLVSEDRRGITIYPDDAEMIVLLHRHGNGSGHSSDTGDIFSVRKPDRVPAEGLRFVVDHDADWNLYDESMGEFLEEDEQVVAVTAVLCERLLNEAAAMPEAKDV